MASETVRNLMVGASAVNLLNVVVTPNAFMITPECRAAVDYWFLFRIDDDDAMRRRAYRAIFGNDAPVDDYRLFSQLLDACTQDFGCLVIKRTEEYQDLRDRVFWYKVMKEE